MATAKLATVIHFYTTPKELREMANHLEERWAKAIAGQEVPKYDTYQGLVVWIDQEEMYKQKAERQRTVER